MEKIYEGKTKTVFKLENGNVLLKFGYVTTNS